MVRSVGFILLPSSLRSAGGAARTKRAARQRLEGAAAIKARIAIPNPIAWIAVPRLLPAASAYASMTRVGGPNHWEPLADQKRWKRAMHSQYRSKYAKVPRADRTLKLSVLFLIAATMMGKASA